MPKIIDHQAHRQLIVSKACHVFLAHGYSQLGMRQLAKELGVSKSALYHYFASKESLFTACIEYITSEDMAFSPCPSNANHEARLDALLEVIQHIDERFRGELNLVMDFTRGMTAEQIQHNQHMQLVEKKYLDLVAGYVGETNARQAYVILLGSLLGRVLNGNETSWQIIKSWLRPLVE